ncbi:MAG: hypothetical protein GW941_00530, partial [Candidatus Pacebacteria bacterium]|nr:hypothetical protein [Candidatus Paceibacterota bacterium]
KDTDIFTTWSAVKKDDTLSNSINRMINLGLELYKSGGRPSAMGAMIGIRKKIMNKTKFDETQNFMEDVFFVQSVCNLGFNMSIFREPRYILSMRRYVKEGTLKSISNGALLQLKFLQGKDFKDEDRYKMEGGSYYDDISPSLFKNILTNIKKMPSQQIKSTRKILNSISKELGI